jgi:hypothetical protein
MFPFPFPRVFAAILTEIYYGLAWDVGVAPFSLTFIPIGNRCHQGVALSPGTDAALCGSTIFARSVWLMRRTHPSIDGQKNPMFRAREALWWFGARRGRIIRRL